MKKTLLFILGFLFLQQSFGQNAGVGTNTATRARLEVVGVAGSGATSGLFGSNNAGISLQRNWPTIGFNQYRDDITSGSQGKFISSGFAAIQYMDPGTGTYAFDMFASGAANTATPAAVRAITIASNGNTSIRGTYTGASLVVARGDGIDGTAVFAGPGLWSHFNYYNNEDTYIRPGLDGGTVYINKIPTGSILVGTTSSHIGINNPGVNPFFTIEVYQPAGQKAFSMVDAYNYRWAMACNFLNTQNNGQGVGLDFYYNNVGRGRFQFWDGAYVVLSDASLKKDVETMEPVLDKITKLRPVCYEMIRNNPDHEKAIGLIAQEVQPLFPLMVRQVNDHNRNGEPIKDALVMDHSGFGVLAIKALQEQQQQLNILEKEKKDLLERLLGLERALDN
ncbi:MAG: tail fiber domain-containing protein [Chitinophagaceae bacterium]